VAQQHEDSMKVMAGTLFEQDPGHGVHTSSVLGDGYVTRAAMEVPTA
jgi:hypothetical protein